MIVSELIVLLMKEPLTNEVRLDAPDHIGGETPVEVSKSIDGTVTWISTYKDMPR